jgi:hypothetical protein
MDKLYRNVKTGEERMLPPYVAEVNKKSWTLIEETAEIGGLSDDPDKPEPTREELTSQYEALAGGKPDGRWSNQKLAQKIQELKDKQ